MTPMAPDPPPISAARKWAITLTVMVVAFMQILDTSVTNVILPHLQGSLSAGLDEVSWVITSYLAANAVVIPATGWLAGLFGRKRFFLICSTLFVISSFVSGAAPDLTTLIVARIFQGLGGGPDHSPLAGHPVGDLPLPAARTGHGGMGRRLHSRSRSWGRPWAATWPTSGRGGGSSTSTCPSGSSASSWAAPSCSTRRTCAGRRGSTGGVSD